MIHGFDTEDGNAAVAALLVYAVYRSRDKARFKVTPEMWGQIERFVAASAKRSRTIPDFLEALKPRMSCATIQPRYLETGMPGDVALLPVINSSGSADFVQPAQPEGMREFGVRIIETADHAAVVRALYRNPTWIVLLVRDRLERERPAEALYETLTDEAP